MLGGGPTGCELAQVFVRFGVPMTSSSRDRASCPTEHPRNAEVVRFALERDGVRCGPASRASAARAGAGTDGAHVDRPRRRLDGRGPRRSCSRSGREFPRPATSGWSTTASTSPGPDAYPRDGRLRLADGLWVVGDPAGPELHTHQGHYQGELAVRMALGEAIVPDYRALPRATYMDPEAASVGLTLDQARERRARRVRVRRRLHEEREGLLGRGGDRPRDDRRRPRDAASSSARRWPARTRRPRSTSAWSRSRRGCTVDVLAETIHAFPCTSRIFNGLFAEARQARQRG